MSNSDLDNDRVIFTNGAYLEALEVEINGIKQWRWVLIGQEGDAFSNGKGVDVHDYANSYEELFIRQGRE